MAPDSSRVKNVIASNGQKYFSLAYQGNLDATEKGT
jgi:hypothetical protein